MKKLLKETLLHFFGPSALIFALNAWRESRRPAVDEPAQIQVTADPQTRSELQTSQQFPSKNNKRDALIVNADGSVDLYFGPKAPAGKEKNWTQTILGKGWWTLLRLYGPLEAWFDKSWRPGEFELAE